MNRIVPGSIDTSTAYSTPTYSPTYNSSPTYNTSAPAYNTSAPVMVRPYNNSSSYSPKSTSYSTPTTALAPDSTFISAPATFISAPSYVERIATRRVGKTDYKGEMSSEAIKAEVLPYASDSIFTKIKKSLAIFDVEHQKIYTKGTWLDIAITILSLITLFIAIFIVIYTIASGYQSFIDPKDNRQVKWIYYLNYVNIGLMLANFVMKILYEKKNTRIALPDKSINSIKLVKRLSD